VPKVDTFVVITDDSLTMDLYYQENVKYEIARDLAHSLNRTLPDLAFTAGLRSFGQGRCLPKEKTSLLTGMAPYSTAGFATAIDQIQCAGGNSPLNLALQAAAADLAGTDSKAAVIVITDGRHMGTDEVVAAEALKARYGVQVNQQQIDSIVLSF